MVRAASHPTAQASPLFTRRRVMIWLLVASALVSLPLVCSTIRARRAQGMYSRWMEYEPPGHLVIYEEDPGAAAQLLATPGYFVMPGGEDKPPMTPDTPVAHFPPQAAAIQKRIPGGCAFLHWLRRQDEEPLVFVSLQLCPGDSAHHSTRAVSFTPYMLNSGAPAEKTPSPTGPPYLLHLGVSDALRVFAGQRDVGDAAHFTIAYVKNGRPGMIHGNLQPDGIVAISSSQSQPPK
jgi:hypothetical protein